MILPILAAWGLVHALHQHLHPGDVRDTVANHNAYGQLKLRLQLPGTNAGIAEPLVACGRAGNAALVFIRLLPKGQAKVGIEFWGAELAEGEAFKLPAADAQIELTCDFPALYPETGDSAWGEISPAVQKLRRSEYLITVDGTPRLKGSINYNGMPHSVIYFGANPLGGSFVSERFSGKILQHSQKLSDGDSSGCGAAH